jgi:acyl carrier protein
MNGHAVDVPDLERFCVWMTARNGDFTTTAPAPDALLVDDLGYDSLALFELVLSLEESFDVEIVEDDIRADMTVADLYQMVA